MKGTVTTTSSTRTLRRGHAIDARAVALCQVRHFAGATDRRREPGRLEIRVRISAQNRRTNEGQSQREQHARDDRPRVVADMLDDLRCEVQAQRCANDPLPGIARRPWTGCAQARDARGRRDQQRAQHPWQGMWAHTATSAPANASTRPAATRHPTLPPFIPSTHMLIGKPDYELVGYLRKLSSPYRVHYCVNHDPIQTARRRHHHLHRDEPVGHRAQGHQPRPGLSRFRSRPGAVRVGIKAMADGHNQYPYMPGVAPLREAIAAKARATATPTIPRPRSPSPAAPPRR